MWRPIPRVTAALVIAPFLLFGSALAPTHEHQPDGDRSHAVVHSHFEPHALDSHDSAEPEVDHSDERVIWLDSPIIHQTTYHLSQCAPLVAATFEDVPPSSSWSPTTSDDVAPVHGPPRPNSSLRGPPSFLA